MNKREGKRIYLSGGITGTIGFLEKFERWEQKLSSVGWAVVNPAKVNAQLPSSTKYNEYMEMSFTMLKMCDAIAMLPGWEESKGARMEYELAKMYSLEIHKMRT